MNIPYSEVAKITNIYVGRVAHCDHSEGACNPAVSALTILQGQIQPSG